MSNDPTAVARAFIATIDREGPAAAVARHCADGYRWWVPGSGEIQDVVVPHSAIMMEMLDERGLNLTIHGTMAEGERVALEAECTARLKDGAVYHNHYHFLFRVIGGRIVEVREYNDTLHASQIWADRFAAATASSAPRPEEARGLD